jgi:hypothetical protein
MNPLIYAIGYFSEFILFYIQLVIFYLNISTDESVSTGSDKSVSYD